MRGLGVSLYLIHIYVAPLKKALQAFWLAGTLGMLYIMATQDAPAALYLAQTPSAVWLADLRNALHDFIACIMKCSSKVLNEHPAVHMFPHHM
eukprot:1156071-Pelagomonas_calceolata.AAC.1